MSHHDKKFEDESQDARRRDQHEEVHPDVKSGEHKVKPTDKDNIHGKNLRNRPATDR